MRTFSQFEKKIIQELVKTDVTTNESNILIFIKNTVLVNKGIYVELKSKTVHIIGKPENKDQDVTEIFETIALFRYLESNDLIFKHSHNNTELVYGLSAKYENDMLAQNGNGWGKFTVPTNIFDIIQDFHKSFIVVGTELKDLVENEFKTTEQIHHESEMLESKKQTKFSKLSFWIALFALVFSLAVPFIFDTKIEQTQIDSLQIELNKIKSSIDTLNFQAIKTLEEMTKKQELKTNENINNTSR